jgi:hypothetical protein
MTIKKLSAFIIAAFLAFTVLRAWHEWELKRDPHWMEIVEFDQIESFLTKPNNLLDNSKRMANVSVNE